VRFLCDVEYQSCSHFSVHIRIGHVGSSPSSTRNTLIPSHFHNASTCLQCEKDYFFPSRNVSSLEFMQHHLFPLDKPQRLSLKMRSCLSRFIIVSRVLATATLQRNLCRNNVLNRFYFVEVMKSRNIPALVVRLKCGSEYKYERVRVAANVSPTSSQWPMVKSWFDSLYPGEITLIRT
jgi:hypothetical protein